ncbi:MAG: hypothetical protein D4R48_03895 [Nitrosomonadales bacterium]|nr:MAG: hypothetical protein D4R48_03895 [Nitrosomonadales bacterium]
MTASSEFYTVDLIVNSSAETRGVDAFALAVIKAERQLRKLFTHLVFQFPCFGVPDIGALRETLANNKTVYFEGIEAGINCLFSCTVEELVGARYRDLHPRIKEAIEHRNKIFHGQLTQRCLSREDLLALISDIRTWCEELANGATSRIEYDGFERNSFRKSPIRSLSEQFKVQLSGVECYDQFIKQHMARSAICSARRPLP